MIEGFIVFICIFIILRAILPPPEDAQSFFADLVCPPHRWEEQEVKDDKGELTGYRRYCPRCKRTAEEVTRNGQ